MPVSNWGVSQILSIKRAPQASTSDRELFKLAATTAAVQPAFAAVLASQKSGQTQALSERILITSFE
jgi:hypothetical protein